MGLYKFPGLLQKIQFINCSKHYFINFRNIGPTENKGVAILAFGEGWHNYHHVFPWDYKAAELGDYKFNITTAFIDFCAWLGLAYDMKTVPVEAIKRRAIRTGDGTKYRNYRYEYLKTENLVELQNFDFSNYNFPNFLYF